MKKKQQLINKPVIKPVSYKISKSDSGLTIIKKRVTVTF